MRTKRTKIFSMAMLVCMLYQLFFPVAAYALTGGPSQPEVESFEPVGTSEMVDLFTGDFNYNIPLLDIDGYPINIAYHSGITMDQEASWVGLGWNLNPGVINRNMRGLPDDFKGDQVEKIQYVKPDRTYGVNLATNIELFGFSKDLKGKMTKILEKVNVKGTLGVGMGITYNNYRGLGIERRLSPAIDASGPLKTPYLKSLGLNAGADITSSSQDGLVIRPRVGIHSAMMRDDGTMRATAGSSVSMVVSSRAGVKNLTVNHSISPQVSYNVTKTDESGQKVTEKRSTPLNISSASSVSFGTQTYTPGIGVQMSNLSLTYTAMGGLVIKGLDPHVSISGYYTGQEVAETHSVRGAAGVLYAEHAAGDDRMMRDFNREKDGVFSEKNPALAIPVLTYDLFAASGQGIGGMFRAYRSDMPVVNDPVMRNMSRGGALAVEAGFADFLKKGLNPQVNYAEVKSGAWEKDNDLLGKKFRYSQRSPNSPFHEPAYFKSIGEKAAVSTGTLAYHEMGSALRPSMGEIAPALRTKDVFIKSDKLEGQHGNKHYETDIRSRDAVRTQRDKRNQLFSYLTVAEADFCLEKNLGVTASNITIPRSSTARKQHHLSEITVANDQGARYVYGIPAYNLRQYDISFTNAINPDKPNELISVECATGQVNYDPALNFDDPDFKNRRYRGNDHGMNITKTPGYAHSYLLTAVLSPDYVDVNNNGPDAADYGKYTKISYNRVASAYKWRIPYNSNKANYSEGLKSNKNDDNASIVYGEKEMWLVKQIEGRDHFAKFIISARKDGLGTLGIHGGKDTTSKSYQLDRIELYSFADPEVPIKTVHFEYSYELCKGVDNQMDTLKGKLTLKKLYFTYGRSAKGRFNSYEFNYDGANPDYNIKSYDRWGNYKPNNCTGAGDVKVSTSVEYPYVDQDKAVTDPRTSAWSLTSIVLPSGGVIRLEYESDDYAYIQNKRATEMVKIRGFADYDPSLKNAALPVSSVSVSSDLYDDKDPRECILFNLSPAIASQGAEAISRYLREMESGQLYYNCLVNLNSQAQGDYREYVRGYTEISDAGVINMSGSSPVGWIRVKERDNGKSHPIALTAWQYARMYTPYLVYPGSNLRQKSEGRDVAEAMIRGTLGFVFDAIDMLDGVNDKLRRENKGKYVDVSNSWIRINTLNGKKLGGGTRVKKLIIEDSWSSVSGGGKNMSYGQEYSYDMKDTWNGSEQVISSGVASYEPAIGSDENPFKLPVAYGNDLAGIPDNEFYVEEPFGESYFPSPQVGYSRVSVKNLVPAAANVNKHGTGKVVYEFYTAREFPTVTSRTGIDARHHQMSGIFKLTGMMAQQHMAMTQGYQVELNDMHGKQKAVYNFVQSKADSYDNRDAFSGIKYEYSVEDDASFEKKLKNEFQVIGTDNRISTQVVGLESEMIMDTREQNSRTFSGAMELNIDIITLPGLFLPLPVPTALPKFSSEISSFRSAVIMRVINRFGILKRTVAFEEGSSIATENVLLDAETGQVLLTRTYNEYNDPVYNMQFPAHWTYDGMGQAYRNQGLEVGIVQPADSASAIRAYVNGHQADPALYFTEGDEIMITEYDPGTGTYTINPNKHWIFVRNGSYYLLDKVGYIFGIRSDRTYSAKVVRSGRRNMQGLPVMQFTSLVNPWQADSLRMNAATQVLNASAVSYSDKWRMQNIPKNNDDGLRIYHSELIDIFNYLLESGQLTRSLSGGTVVPISNAYAGAQAYFGSDIRKFANENGVDDEFMVVKDGIPTWASNDWGFRIGTVVLAGDFINARIKPDPTWTPKKIRMIAPISNTEASAVLTYLDASNAQRDTIIQVNFGHISPAPLYACDNFFPIVNPFISGIRGNWRSQKDWVYYDSRSPKSVASGNATNTRKDGAYSTFAPFLVKNTGGGARWKETADKGKWTQSREITRYDSWGNEIENVDPIGRYSSVMYGYNNTLPVAVANNARVTEIGADGCEDPILWSRECAQKHLDFGLAGLSRVISGPEGPVVKSNVTSTVAHSGRQAYLLEETDTIHAEHQVNVDTSSYRNTISGRYFRLDRNDINGYFSPGTGRYVISGWVKVGRKPAAFTYENKADTMKSCRLEVVFPGSTTTRYYARPSGPIIEGWQRIEKVFDVPASAKKVFIRMVPSDEPGTTTMTYFDDIRVHPFDASVKSFVYDPLTRRLTAELDENNYATFYEYDAEGQLVRVKRETDKGIVTIKESRTHQHKKK